MGSIPLIHTIADVRNISSLTLIFALGILCYATISRLKGDSQRNIILGLLLMLVPFLPASNLFFPVGFVLAERVLYIPSIGFIILLVEASRLLHERLKGRGYLVMYCLLILSTLWTGRTVMRNQVWQDRQSLFISGLTSTPQNAKMHYNYANLMKDFGNIEQATHHYQQAIKLWPKYASAYNNLGTVERSTEKAEILFRKAIDLHPGGHAGAYFNLANLLRSRDDRTGSISALKRCLEIDGGFSEAHSTLALLLGEQGNSTQAELHYRRAVQLTPSNPHFHNNLAVFLANSGNVKNALLSYERAYETDTTHYTSMINAAKLLHSQGHNNQSKELMERALSVSNDAEVLDAAATFYYNIRDVQKAYNLYRQLLTIYPQNTQYALNYVETLVKMGKLQDAIRIVSWVLEQKPFNVKAAQHLANIYGLSQQHTQASRVLELALRYEKRVHKRATLYLEIANHLKDSGQLDMAFKNYQEAVVLDPTCGEAHFNLAVFYHLSGQLLDAELHYNEASKLLPNNKLLQDNIKKLDRTRKQCENIHNCFVIPSLGTS